MFGCDWWIFNCTLYVIFLFSTICVMHWACHQWWIKCCLICNAGILSIEELPASVHVLEDVYSYPWHIDTKYYTADVLLCTTAGRTIGDKSFAEAVQAFVIMFDSKQVWYIIFLLLLSIVWCCAFGALTLLVGHQKSIRPVKYWVIRWCCGYLSGVRCKWFAYGPADATVTPSSLASLKSRMVWPFWCRLTQVILEKRPLNGCLSIASMVYILLHISQEC